MKKALFVTFDETLVTTLSGKKYSIHGEDWKFILNTVEIIKKAIKDGYVICFIINQIGIELGYISEKTFLRKVELIIKTLEKDLKLKTNTINYMYCSDSESYLCLPNPGMIYELAVEHEIDVVNSCVVSHTNTDKVICTNSGVINFKLIHTFNENS